MGKLKRVFVIPIIAVLATVQVGAQYYPPSGGGGGGGVTSVAGTANQITVSGATGSVTFSIPTNPTLPGTTTGTFSGGLTGSASQLGGVAAASYALLASPTFTGTVTAPTVNVTTAEVFSNATSLSFVNGSAQTYRVFGFNLIGGNELLIGSGGGNQLGYVDITGGGAAKLRVEANVVAVGPGNVSAPAATLDVFDATGSTGVTTLNVRSGAGQTAASATVDNNASTKSVHFLGRGTEPGISGCSAVKIGTLTDYAGRITSGTTGACTITLTFGTAYGVAPSCVVNNETTAVIARASNVLTTAFDLVSVTNTSDVLSYTCGGR